MLLKEKLYQAYLEELQALENFKASHTELHRGADPDSFEDPYTKRLLEALAFFMARNRLQGEQKIVDLYQRLFNQYFSFVASPLPAMGLMQFHPSLELLEKTFLRAGREVYITNSDGRQACFQLLDSLNILPVSLQKFQFNTSKGVKPKLTLQYQSSFARAEEIGLFRLYINHLNHFASSLSLALALQHFLEKIEICYEAPELTQQETIPCDFSFGLLDNSLFNHPIEKIRSLLHFPEQELFLNIQVPPAYQSWRSFTLSFHFKEEWPKTFQLSKETLIPFVVPIVNLKKEPAEPIKCEGIKDYYPILHPNPDETFHLQRILGVYEIQKNKTIPIKPGIISQEPGNYEIKSTSDLTNPIQHKLLLDFPDAFQKPKVISIEALWFQPWFSDSLEQEFKMKLANHALPGLELRLIGKICAHENSLSSQQIDFLVRLLSLKNQANLELEDLLFLMNAIKKINESHFKNIPLLIRELIIEEMPCFFSTRTTTEYHFQLEAWEDKDRELVLLFFKYVRNFLDSWLSHTEIVIKISCHPSKNSMYIKEGSNNEISVLVRDFFLS